MAILSAVCVAVALAAGPLEGTFTAIARLARAAYDHWAGPAAR